MSRKRIAGFVLVGCMVLFFLSSGIGNAKTITWTASSAFGSGLKYYQAAAYFAERVKQMTNGQFIIHMNTGGSIVPAFMVQEAVHNGSLDLGCSSSMYVRGKFPAGVLFGTSFGKFKQQEFMAWLENGGGYELWQEMYDRKGYNVYVLPPPFILGPECLGWFRKPIRTLDDFKGLKIRTVGEWGEVMTKCGASVMTLPLSELYTALEKGVLDAADMGIPSVDKTIGLYEICKYVAFPGVHQLSTPGETLVNKDKWDVLPDHLKAIVKTALREACFKSMTDWTLDDAEAVEFFKSKGIQIIKLDPEIVAKIKRIGEAVFDERAEKDPFYGKVLASQRKFHKLWEGYERLQSIE